MAVVSRVSSRPRGEGRSQPIRTPLTSSHPDREPGSSFPSVGPVSSLYLQCWDFSVYGFSYHVSLRSLQPVSSLFPSSAHHFDPPSVDSLQAPPVEPVYIPGWPLTFHGIFSHQDGQAEIWVSSLTLPLLLLAYSFQVTCISPATVPGYLSIS